MIRYVVSLMAVMTFFSCKRGYEQIDLGKDGCAHCKMTIIDARYSAEIVDKKGKIFKFDDVVCMRAYIHENNLPEKDLLLFVVDYDNPETAIDARTGIYLRSEKFSSPMNGNFAVFASPDKAAIIQSESKVEKYTWETIK